MNSLAEQLPEKVDASGIEVSKIYFCIGVTAWFAASSIILWPSTSSILNIWATSNTYLYGMIIPPISLALILRLERNTDRIHLVGNVDGLAAIGIFGVMWLLGRMIDVNFVHHLALVGLISSSIAVFAGAQNTRNWLFPLGFLLFTAPAGGVFQPMLQEVATNVTVFLLKTTGFDVERAGSILTTTAGRFDVTPACAGLNFLLAAIITALLVSHLSFKSIRKSLVFLSLCIVVAIISNWLRIYLIVTAATLSDMSLGIGADHLWFGWILFAAAISVLIWRAKHYADEDLTPHRIYSKPIAKTYHPMLLAFVVFSILVSLRTVDYFLRANDLVSLFTFPSTSVA